MLPEMHEAWGSIPNTESPIFFQNISRGCDQSKAECLVMGELFVSDNYFLTLFVMLLIL